MAEERSRINITIITVITTESGRGDDLINVGILAGVDTNITCCENPREGYRNL